MTVRWSGIRPVDPDKAMDALKTYAAQVTAHQRGVTEFVLVDRPGPHHRKGRGRMEGRRRVLVTGGRQPPKPKGPHVDLHSPLDLISICTGGGGLDAGVELAIPSARPVLYVEREAYACARLVEAMEEGRLAEAPIWSDACTLNGRPWRGLVDGLIGGIPCQPHSLAGKRLGEDDERDLWTDTRRLICQGRPWFVLIENVLGMFTAKPGSVPGAERVRRDLHRLGFQVEGGIFSAEGVGLNHERERVFILGVANTPGSGWERRQSGGIDRLGKRPAAERNGGDLATQELAHGYRVRQPRLGEFDRQQIGREDAARWRHLDDPEGLGRGEGRSEHELWSRWRAVTDAGRSLADTVGSVRDGGAVQPERGPEGRGIVDGAGSFPVHAPGPDDLNAWGAVLAERPDFAPALPKSALRRLADGMDRPRIDELRLFGNGVVPLAAGYAVRTLATRLASRSSPGAAVLVRLMAHG